jgi:hypothetical protein
MTTMMKYFDIITDNYITRSLNTREAYQAPLRHMSEYSQSALDNLRKFDWILLLDDGKDDDSTNRLLNKGLGLSSYLRKAMVKPRSQEVSVSNGDKQMLLNLNRFDYAIWSEARRLHELDVQSLKYMEKYGHDLYANRDERVKGDSSCCGGVCVS